jgi:hypothetical protein
MKNLFQFLKNSLVWIRFIEEDLYFFKNRLWPINYGPKNNCKKLQIKVTYNTFLETIGAHEIARKILQ